MRSTANRRMIILLAVNIAATLLCRSLLASVFETAEAMAREKKQIPVTIIMYHSLLRDGSKAGEFVVSPAQFENDIRYLIDNGYHFITMTDLISYVNKRWARLPDKPVMITFDDGYYNNYMYAFPIAQKYKVPFVLSVLGYYTDIIREDEKQSGYYSHVTWEQIREMSESDLVDIQNHSYNLHKISQNRAGSKKGAYETVEEYEKFLSEDLMKLQKLLKQNSGVTPNTFVYPFGRISPESVDILKGLGFQAALTCSGGINRMEKGDTEALFSLKRYNRPHGLSSEAYFKGKLAE